MPIRAERAALPDVAEGIVELLRIRFQRAGGGRTGRAASHGGTSFLPVSTAHATSNKLPTRIAPGGSALPLLG